MKKRLIAFLLVLIMVLGMLPVSALAADGDATKNTYHLIHEFNYVGGSRWDIEATTAAESYQIDVNTGKPTRDRYKFDGWADEANATTATYFGGELITLTKDNPTKIIYAVWKPIFELHYNANGGTGAPDSQTYTSYSATSTQATFTSRNQIPTKDGYTFKGWADSAAATTAQYQPGGTIPVKHENSPKTVYAVWEKNDSPVPDNPGGTKPDVANAQVKICVQCIEDSATHQPKNYGILPGAYVDGLLQVDGTYYYSITLNRAKYIEKFDQDSGKTHTDTEPNESIQFKWQWKNGKWELISDIAPVIKCQCEKQVEEKYTVTYTDGVDGKFFEDVVFSDLKSGVATPAFGKDPYHPGYTFAGWEPVVAATVTETVTYVAKWTPVEPKAPTADELKKLEMAVQVKCVVDASQQHTAAYGLLGEYDEDYFVGEPRKDGDDWLCDISYLPDRYVAAFNKAFPTPKHIQNDEKIVPVTLIWAGDSWQLKTQGRVLVTEVYTVTFNSYGGTPVPPAQEVEYGLTATKPADPTLKGYTFAFWYLGEDEQNATAYDFDTPVTENITLTAKWNINKYTVAFNTDGGTPVPPAQEVEYGLTATEPAAPEKTGYTFDGWYLGDEKYDFSAAVEQNITLTAKWQKKTFTVKYYLPDETGAWVEKKMDTVDSVDYATYSLWTPNAEDGYEFSGWYQKPADIGVKAKVEKLYMAKEWKLYGKFTPIEYTIQYVYNDGKATSTNPTTYTVESDTITLADATGADWGKTFLEWHDENGQKITEIPTGSTGDRVITAYWNWPVHLHYLDKDNNEIESATLYVSELEPGACVLPTGEKTGYDFDGWYEAKKDIGTASHKLNALSIAKKWELYGRYTAKTDVSYTVKYLREGDNKVLAPEKVVTDQTFDTEVTENAADVIGYTPDAPSKTMILDEYNKVLTFSYSANTYHYEVHYFLQAPDGSYMEKEVDKTPTGVFDTTVTITPDPNRYGAHYSYNSGKSTVSGVVTVDDPTTILKLYVYYDLDFHTLTFDTMGGSKIAPETVRHGLTVAKPKDPVNGGFLFDGWYTDKTYRTPYNFATPLTQDTTIYAKWFLIVLPGVTVKKNTPKLNTADHFAYVQGYPDGTVKPAGNITRAETAAILFRLMDDASRKTYYSTKSGFRDVASGSWYNTYVATLNNAGVITDSSNGYFRPNEAITRAELAAMLAKFSETTSAANYFNDVSAKYWAANAIAICAKLGWITGYPDGTFRPDRNVTRAELMAMINRATGRAPKSADAFLPGMKTWIDNTSDKWYYLDVQEATNSHSYTVKGSETWTALTSDPNWSLYE